MGRRKKPSKRVASILKALGEVPKATKEIKQAERAKAQADKAKAEADVKEARLRARVAELQAEAVKVHKRTAGPALRIAVQRTLKAEQVASPARAPQPLHVAHVPPEPKPELITRVTHDPDGQPRTEYIRGRDGEPLKAYTPTPAPAPPPMPAPAPIRSRVSCGPGGEGKLPPWAGRQPTVAELKAAHEGRSGAVQISNRDGSDVQYYARFPVIGFSNPGGIVGHNVIVEDTGGINYCRVAGGVWPKQG